MTCMTYINIQDAMEEEQEYSLKLDENKCI